MPTDNPPVTIPNPSPQPPVAATPVAPTPPPPVAPLPPVMPPPPASPPPPPAMNTSPPPKKKSRLLLVIFIIFGIAIIAALGITTGLMSRVVPGLGSTTITYWGLWEPESSMRTVLDEFEKTHPGIKVKYQMESPQEYRERLQSAISQGRGPDVFRIHNTWFPMFSSSLSPVPTSVFSPSDYSKVFYPVAAANFGKGGTFYAVPLEVDGIAMFINDDLLGKSGLSVPQNWDELRDAALAMSVCETPSGKCDSGGKILVSGAALGSTSNVDHWEDIVAVLMLQNNVDLNNINKPDPKPAQDVLDFYSSFSDTYHIWDSNLPTSTANFAAGKVGIYFGPSWRVFDIQNLNPNLHFSVYPIPQLPTDPNRGEKPITYASYWAEAVNNHSSHQAQAWELIKYLSSPDVMKKLYQNVQNPQRSFGEPYSRTDLSSQLQGSKYTNAFASQAPLATSWYLGSYTHDGATGINSQLSNLFAQTLAHTKTLSVLAGDINKVLSGYGIFVSSAQVQTSTTQQLPNPNP